MANDFFVLPYNPSDYEIDKRYIDKEQVDDVIQFISERYSKNKKHILPIVENTMATFINNGSNIYSGEVLYPDWEDEKFIKRRRSTLALLEKYYNANKYALKWNYIKNKKAKSKALHASEFIIMEDDKLENKTVIIRTGEYNHVISSENSEIWYYFKMWNNGTVYSTKAKNWDFLPPLNTEYEDNNYNTGWEFDKDQKKYKVLPFSLIGSDRAQPLKSTLPTIENIISGGVAWGDIAAQRGFLKVLLGKTSLNASEWKTFNENIGLFLNPNLKQTDSDIQNSVELVDMGDAKTQLEWQEFIKDSLKRIAYSEGVDVNGLFSELKVESGTARILAMENIIRVRDSRIPIWEDFEEEDQEVLKEMGIISNTSEVVYSELGIGETKLDRENLEEKRQANIINRYKNGTITRIMFVMEMENLTESEAIAMVKTVDSERGEDINMPINGTEGETSEEDTIKEE